MLTTPNVRRYEIYTTNHVNTLVRASGAMDEDEEDEEYQQDEEEEPTAAYGGTSLPRGEIAREEKSRFASQDFHANTSPIDKLDFLLGPPPVNNTRRLKTLLDRPALQSVVRDSTACQSSAFKAKYGPWPVGPHDSLPSRAAICTESAVSLAERMNLTRAKLC